MSKTTDERDAVVNGQVRWGPAFNGLPACPNVTSSPYRNDSIVE